MHRMLQISPKVMSKEKNSKLKDYEKSEKRNVHKKSKVQRKVVSPSADLNPVVVLDRLPKDYCKGLIVSPVRRLNAIGVGKSKVQLKNHGAVKKKNTARRSEWPEAYEGCSYDDSLAEEASVFLNNLANEGIAKEDKDEPEIDVIDGVKFLSFLHEPDIRKYSCFHSSYDPFFSDWGSENSRDSSFSDDFKQLIIPTKTRDITQIKGWRKKLFGDCNEYASMPPEDIHPEENSSRDFYDSENEKDYLYNPAMGTCDEGEIIFDDANEDKTTGKSGLDQDTLQSHLVLSKLEFKAANSKSAFQSKGLEEFLGQKSELNIGLLSQYNPNVKVIEKDSPILAVGTLKKDDYVPPWKKLMERQRKRKELLNILNSRREAEAAREAKKENVTIRKESEKTKMDVVETELGNKIVWLDDEDSDSDQIEPPVETENDKLQSKNNEEEDIIDQKFNTNGYNVSPKSDTRDFKKDTFSTDSRNTGDKKDLLASIKQEPIFEESTKENSMSDKNVHIGSERTKREKKLSWKLLNSYEQPTQARKGKHNKSPLLNADSNRKDSTLVEEPIRISLKHSPDRSSWVINNVISDTEFAARKKKGKRKIRNYSFIYSNDEGLVKDNLPKFEIITQTVWSRNKVLEKEFYQFLTELRTTPYENAMRRYQRSSIFEDKSFPKLSEWDAMAACHSLNMVPKLNADKSNASRHNGTNVVSRNSLPYKKSVSRLAQLQNSLRCMDLDPSSLLQGESNSSSIDVEVTKTSRGRITTPPKRLLDSTVNIDQLSDDADEACFRPTEPPKRKKTMMKIPESISTFTIEPEKYMSPESISDDAIVLDDSSSGDDSSNRLKNKLEKPKVTRKSFACSETKLPHSDSFPVQESTSPTVVHLSPGGTFSSDDIIELPSPEANKSDEEVAVMIKKRTKEPIKKRKKQNRELQKTLILKSFRQVTSGNTVLKSLIVANTNISSKVKDNMSLGLCAVGLTLNKANEGKNDIFLLYGRINDSVYNDAVRKSFYEEQHGIQTHHFVVPIVLEITKAAMKSSSDLKLVKIPLKGRALIDNQTDSVPLMLYPVATKPPDEDLVNYSSKNECDVPEVPSAIPRSPSSSQDSFSSTKIVKDVRRSSSLLKKGEDVPIKKSKVVQIDKFHDLEGDIDILLRSDEEVEVSVPSPVPNSLGKKLKFMALNRTEPICRLNPKYSRSLLPLTGKITADATCPRPGSGIILTQAIPRGAVTNVTPATPRSTSNPASGMPRGPINIIRGSIQNTSNIPCPSVFSGTFGASKALATLVADSQAQQVSKPTNMMIKGITLNGIADDDATLVKKILSDPKPVSGNSKTKELKLLSTKQLSMISGIVESAPTELPDQGLDQELRSAAQAAWQLFGPCIVRRVKLKNGNVVYVYQCANPADNASPPQQIYNPRPPVSILAKPDVSVPVNVTNTNNSASNKNRATIAHQRPKAASPDQNLVNISKITKSTNKYATQQIKTSQINCTIGSGVPLPQPSIVSTAAAVTTSQALTSLPILTNNSKSTRFPTDQKKLELKMVATEISSIPKGIVSPIPIQPLPKAVTNSLPIEKSTETKFDCPPSPPLSPQNRADTKRSSYNNDGGCVPSLTENVNSNTSVWISTDGEPCYVMRLDVNEPAANESSAQTEEPQEDPKVPTIIGCFPISEEEFHKNDASNVEAVT